MIILPGMYSGSHWAKLPDDNRRKQRIVMIKLLAIVAIGLCALQLSTFIDAGIDAARFVKARSQFEQVNSQKNTRHRSCHELSFHQPPGFQLVKFQS